MFLRADGGLRAVRMVRPEFCAESREEFALVVGKSDVVFLVNSLQLGVESANHHVLETVGLDLCPVFYFVAGDVFGIASHVVAGICVGSFGTDGGHQLVVFVGNEILGGELRDAVNLMVFLFAQCGVGDQAVLLVAFFNLVEQRCFGLWIVRAEEFCAFEHQMLQIVSQTGGLCRVVLGAGAHGHVGLDARSLLVHAEIHFQSVVECVDAGG